LDLKGGGVSCEKSFTLGDKFVEGEAGLYEGPLPFETQIFNILNQQYLSETASEIHSLHLIESSRLSEKHLTLLPHEELCCGVRQHFQLYIINNNQWLLI
jgi:hypothetical protein